MKNERNRSRLTDTVRLENGGEGEQAARSNLGISTRMNVQMYTYVLLSEIDSWNILSEAEFYSGI